MGIRNKIGNIDIRNAGGFSWAAYWAGQCLYYFTERSGLSLIDSIAENNAPIITSAHYWTSGRCCVTPIVLNVANGFHLSGSYLYKADLATNIYRNIVSYRKQSSDGAEGIWTFCISNSNKFTFFYKGQAAYRVYAIDAITPTDGTWYDFDIAITAGVLTFSVNASSIDPVAFVVPTSLPDDQVVTFMANTNNLDTATGYLTNLYLGSAATYWKYHFQEVNVSWFYDVGPNAVHVERSVGFGNFGAFVNTKSDHCLSHGYAVWTKAANPDIIVPFSDLDTEITPIAGTSIPAGYAKSYSRAGSLIGINMCPCIIRLPNNEITDRSDTDSFNAACRAASYYDAGNVNDFRCLEISNVKVLASYLNVGYKGRIFPFVTTQLNGVNYETIKLDGLVIMIADKTGSREGAILTETGNKVYALLDGGNYTYDDDNYVILNI